VLSDIKRVLDEYGYVALSGIGGMGKSELARKYAALKIKTGTSITAIYVSCNIEIPSETPLSRKTRFSTITTRKVLSALRTKTEILNYSAILTPEKFLAEMKGNADAQTGEMVGHEKDDDLTEGDLDKHLEKLFDLIGLLENKAQADVMRNMSLTPLTSFEWTEAENQAVYELVKAGWVTEYISEDDRNVLSLHPVISDICAKILWKPKRYRCE